MAPAIKCARKRHLGSNESKSLFHFFFFPMFSYVIFLLFIYLVWSMRPLVWPQVVNVVILENFSGCHAVFHKIAFTFWLGVLLFAFVVNDSLFLLLQHHTPHPPCYALHLISLMSSPSPTNPENLLQEEKCLRPLLSCPTLQYSIRRFGSLLIMEWTPVSSCHSAGASGEMLSLRFLFIYFPILPFAFVLYVSP